MGRGIVLWLCYFLTVCGCKALVPSNERAWVPALSQLATADFQGDLVTVHNIRNARFTQPDESRIELEYYDATFDLRKLDTVDLIVVPFADLPDLAHVMVSFGFGGERYVCISAEVRIEATETYDPLKALFNQYELQYVVGDERDLINLRTTARLVDVYLYPTKATPAQARKMFENMLRRANQLADEPEFYNTLTNNCTTNIVRHVNELRPNLIRYGTETLLPAHSPRLAYDLGLIDNRRPFAEVQASARINELAYRHRHDEDFSQKIRRR
ncbi:MAG: DUF4105 domain-containing protein [Pirellulales bacterium]|nr:DUF4105 domain-containing protein [Pirellulales bacterium]